MPGYLKSPTPGRGDVSDFFFAKRIATSLHKKKNGHAQEKQEGGYLVPEDIAEREYSYDIETEVRVCDMTLDCSLFFFQARLLEEVLRYSDVYSLLDRDRHDETEWVLLWVNGEVCRRYYTFVVRVQEGSSQFLIGLLERLFPAMNRLPHHSLTLGTLRHLSDCLSVIKTYPFDGSDREVDLELERRCVAISQIYEDRGTQDAEMTVNHLRRSIGMRWRDF